MARLPRKLTTAALGSYQVRWLRDEAEREGNADLVKTCDVGLSAGGPGGPGLRQIQHARKIVVDEINRRVGHPVSGGGRSIGVTKPAAQLEREIKAVTADPFASLPAGPITIVVAWTEDTQEIAPGQKTWRHDLGERPKFVDVKKAHAAMWLNEGTATDAAGARKYVKKDHPDSGRVFVYPTTEKDPLGRARREVLVGGGS